MAESAQGVVNNVRRNNAGYWNAKVGSDWYGMGKESPRIAEGDYISFEFTRRGNFMNLDPNTIEKKEANVQAAPSIARAAAASGGGGGREDYWAKKEERDMNVQSAIHWQSSRGNAIEAVAAMVTAGVVTMPAAKAKKYDVFMSLVDEVTTRFYEDVQYVYENQSPPLGAGAGTPMEGDDNEEE